MCCIRSLIEWLLMELVLVSITSQSFEHFVHLGSFGKLSPISNSTDKSGAKGVWLQTRWVLNLRQEALCVGLEHCCEFEVV